MLAAVASGADGHEEHVVLPDAVVLQLIGALRKMRPWRPAEGQREGLHARSAGAGGMLDDTVEHQLDCGLVATAVQNECATYRMRKRRRCEFIAHAAHGSRANEPGRCRV